MMRQGRVSSLAAPENGINRIRKNEGYIADMDAEAKEAKMKDKLERYLAEACKMGCVYGFQHFFMYLRGKEEMTITVYHEPQVSSRRCSILHPAAEISATESFTSAQLPYDKQALVLSQGTQMILSGLKDRGVGLPPASPSDNEQHSASASSSTVFLMAGYARYACPYVWVRSNHQRLMKISGTKDREKDHPLRLKSTSKWRDEDVHVWEIIAELVKLCMYPAPRNPFAVDLKHLMTFPTQQQMLATAAMLSCLQKIIITTSDDKPYLEKVLEDVVQVSRLHYTALLSMVTSQQLPVYQQKVEARERHRTSSSSSGDKRTTFFIRDCYPSGALQLVDWDLCSSPGANMTVHSTQGIYTPQGSALQGFTGFGFTPAPSLF